MVTKKKMSRMDHLSFKFMMRADEKVVGNMPGPPLINVRIKRNGCGATESAGYSTE